MIHPGADAQAALLGLVHQQHPFVLDAVEFRGQRVLKSRGHPGIGVGPRQRFVRQQFRQHGDPRRVADRLHLITDRRDRPLREGHQPDRRDADRAPGRRHPFGAPGQQPGAEVEDPLVRAQLPVSKVERLVADEQPDELAVGHVDDLLPGLRQTVGRLGVGQRPRLVHTVEISSRQAVRLALVQVGPPAHMTVGQRENGLGLGQRVQVQTGFPEVPRLYGERVLHYHWFSGHSSGQRFIRTSQHWYVQRG